MFSKCGNHNAEFEKIVNLLHDIHLKDHHVPVHNINMLKLMPGKTNPIIESNQNKHLFTNKNRKSQWLLDLSGFIDDTSLQWMRSMGFVQKSDRDLGEPSKEDSFRILNGFKGMNEILNWIEAWEMSSFIQCVEGEPMQRKNVYSVQWSARLLDGGSGCEKVVQRLITLSRVEWNFLQQTV